MHGVTFWSGGLCMEGRLGPRLCMEWPWGSHPSACRDHPMHSCAWKDVLDDHPMHSCARGDTHQRASDAQLCMRGLPSTASDAQLCMWGHRPRVLDAQLYIEGHSFTGMECTAVHAWTAETVP